MTKEELDAQFRVVVKTGKRGVAVRWLRDNLLALSEMACTDFLSPLLANDGLSPIEKRAVEESIYLMRELIAEVKKSPADPSLVPPLPLPCSLN